MRHIVKVVKIHKSHVFLKSPMYTKAGRGFSFSRPVIFKENHEGERILPNPKDPKQPVPTPKPMTPAKPWRGELVVEKQRSKAASASLMQANVIAALRKITADKVEYTKPEHYDLLPRLVRDKGDFRFDDGGDTASMYFPSGWPNEIEDHPAVKNITFVYEPDEVPYVHFDRKAVEEWINLKTSLPTPKYHKWLRTRGKERENKPKLQLVK